MTIPTFPTLVGLEWPVTKQPYWDTLIQKPISGKETRLQLWTYPRYQYTLSFSVLGSGAQVAGTTNTDWNTLIGFFNQVGGAALPFHFYDANDNSVTAQSLGEGNGTTTTFNFIRSLGGFIEPIQDVTQNSVYVYVNDFQGNLLRVSTSRTNYVEYSAATSTSPWSLTNLTATTGQLDPAGNTSAVEFLETVTNGVHSISQTIQTPLPGNSTNLVVSAFIKPQSRTIAYMKVTNLAGSTYTAYFNLTSTGSIGTTSGSPLSTGITYLPSEGYYRCWIEFPSGSSGSTAPVITISPSVSGADAGSYAGNTSDGLYIWGVQLENNTTVGNYIGTTSTQATETDYSFVTDANWGFTYAITFEYAPLNNAAITATFSYNWPCRFDDDKMAFSQFMSNYWDCKKVVFSSMKVV